jgi:hypothetical protein
VPAELRQINAVPGGTVPQTDIRAMTVNSITYRSMRGMGIVCQTPTSTEVRVWNTSTSPWIGYRTPQAGRDSVYVFIENDSDLSSDDAWQPARISAVASGNVCPGGAAGYTLTINPGVAALTSATSGAPARTYEVMQLALYQPAGEAEWWLGAQSVSAGENMQPVLGPLMADSGFTLRYLDGTGAVTADRTQVKSITVTLRGLTDQAITTGTGSTPEVVSDSLVTQVVLRNALR